MLKVLNNKVTGSEFFTKMVLTSMRESEIADNMEEVQGMFPEVKVGSYPRIESGGPRVRIVLRSRNLDTLEEAVALLNERIGR